MVERLSREKVIARGEKIVNQWYMDNEVKILYYTRRSLQSDCVERIDIRYASAEVARDKRFVESLQ